MIQVVEQRPASLPLAPACRALGLNRSTVYAWQKARTDKPAPRTSRQECPQPRALSESERQEVLDTLNSPVYCDQPPVEVYAQLLEEGRYLCSPSTMHRLLRSVDGQGERRQQRPAQHHAIPRLEATQPNEVWTWDITKLATTRRGVYLSLYVVLDLFSRFIVAWMVSCKENSALAQQLMDEATDRYAIGDNQLTVHQDRGSPMTAHGYLDLMSELGVTCSHSRPRVSNDNPFSESQFKTLKYQPDYPGRFTHIEHARLWCHDYFDWYNLSHHHSRLAGYTPEQVFTGRYKDIVVTRQQALDEQYQRYPSRFVKGRPVASLPPTRVMINPIQLDESGVAQASAVNFPTLTAAGYKRKEKIH